MTATILHVSASRPGTGRLGRLSHIFGVSYRTWRKTVREYAMPIYKCVLIGFNNQPYSVSEVVAATTWGARRRARAIFLAAPPTLGFELWRRDKLVAEAKPRDQRRRARYMENTSGALRLRVGH